MTIIRGIALAVLLIGATTCATAQPTTCQNRPAWPAGCAFEQICDDWGICL